MIDKDCSSSLIFGIVCQLDRDQCFKQSQIDKHEDPSSLKKKRENSDRCWCAKHLSFVWQQIVNYRYCKLINDQSWRINVSLDGRCYTRLTLHIYFAIFIAR